MSGGLAGVLWSGLVTTPWLARGTGVAPAAETAAHLVAGAALRVAAGAALGFSIITGNDASDERAGLGLERHVPGAHRSAYLVAAARVPN